MKNIYTPPPRKDNFFTKRREPFNFMLWLGIFGIGLMFLTLSLTYIARIGNPNWHSFDLPRVFWLSTLLIVLSSWTLHQANLKIVQDEFLSYRIYLTATLLLGFGFVALQYNGWLVMQSRGILMDKSLAGAFLYVISGLHVVHILGGLVFLLIAWVEAIRYRKYVDSFIYSVNPPNQLRLRLTTKYWHFVDILWLILFVFFVFQHS